ncbi:MAG: biotin/lipoyl-binding carrier protein [Hyphomicrobiaceae bacterium]|nr:biotin/lipoyl-binding carrier protein [Hyphomicrobiaceae bacterium]
MADIEARTEVAGSVWKILAEVGQRIEAGDTIMLIESMKMEIPVTADATGTLARLLVEEKSPVAEGQLVAVLAP